MSLTKKQKLLNKKERKLKTKGYQERLKKKLFKKAWELQKQRLRKRANFQDLIECYTCYKLIPVKESQCGHFWHGKLDLDLRNIKIQCSGCNLFKHGNLTTYASRLIREHGQEWFLELDRDASRDRGYTIEQLQEIIKKYAPRRGRIKT